MRSDFYEIAYSNEKFVRSVDELFFIRDYYNYSIYKKLELLSSQKGDLGVNRCENTLVFGEWGMVLNPQGNIYKKIINHGWFHEAYSHLSKRNSGFFEYHENEISLICDVEVESIEYDCALLSFPGALTYGHWIVDIIMRYEALNYLRLNHKIEKFILPKSVGKWSNIFLEYMNLEREKYTESFK